MTTTAARSPRPPWGTLTFDRQLKVHSADERFCELFGCTRAEVEGQAADSFLLPTDNAGTEAFYRKTMSADEQGELLLALRVGAKELYCAMRLTPGAAGWVAYVEDALAADSLTLELLLGQERWKSAMRDAGADGFVFLDAKRCIVDHNARFFELMAFRSSHGVPLNEDGLRGRDLFALVEDGAFAPLEAALGQARARNRHFQGSVTYRGRAFQVRMSPTVLPVLGYVGCSIAVRDLTDEQLAGLAKQLEEQAAEARRQAAEKERALKEVDQKLAVIERQRLAIRELSTPVLQLWESVLALPIIGAIDSRRSADITERLLSEISKQQARFVILDVTGVDVVDTQTADHFIKMIKSAELLGTTCLVTGIRPAVAQTLVGIGVGIAATTLRTLQDGLRECIRRMEANRRSPARGSSSPSRTRNS